jgi:hypothetical protein
VIVAVVDGHRYGPPAKAGGLGEAGHGPGAFGKRAQLRRQVRQAHPAVRVTVRHGRDGAPGHNDAQSQRDKRDTTGDWAVDQERRIDHVV